MAGILCGNLVGISVSGHNGGGPRRGWRQLSIMRIDAMRYVCFTFSFLVVLLPSAGLAEVVAFATRLEWESSVGDHLKEDFEGFDALVQIPLEGGVFETEHFSIQVDRNHGRIGLAEEGFFLFRTPRLSGQFFVGDVHAPGQSNPHFNTIHFHQPITAFAANFDALDDGGIWDIVIEGKSFVLTAANPPSDLGAFLGVVSDTPFDTVDIRNANGVLERYGLDDVSFVTVPEVSSWGLAIVSLPFLCLIRRGSVASGQPAGQPGQPGTSIHRDRRFPPRFGRFRKHPALLAQLACPRGESLTTGTPTG